MNKFFLTLFTLFALFGVTQKNYAAGNDRPVIVLISIKKQTLTVVDASDTSRVILATKISSGRIKKSTPKGKFQILRKRISRLSKKYGGVMTYWNCLTPDESIGIHGLKDRSYQRYLGKPVSHGCIRISKKIEKEFYALAPIGTEVLIE